MNLKTCLGVLLACFCCFGSAAAIDPVKPVALSLKQRQPHWRPKIMEKYEGGQPRRVLFYEQIGDANEAPVKQIFFYPNGQVQAETDLVLVPEDSRGAKEWKSIVVPHGMSVSYFDTETVEKVAFYDRGVLHGPMKVFFRKGELHGECFFKQGERHGPMVTYFEGGVKEEEALFDEGKILGELIKYHAKGTRAALIPYANGIPHGNAFEWYESGSQKAHLHYKEGVLHSEGKNPALIRYTEDRSIEEVQDFNQGQPVGTHVKYHPNGKESYKVQYKKGKKQGKEQFFTSQGKLAGEGLYKEGIPVGVHERKSEEGTLVYLAKYDNEGHLLEPIQEFSPKGIKIAQYRIVDGKREGDFRLWTEGGIPQAEYHYAAGNLEGEQREYHPNGQLKAKAFYEGNVKEGSYEEWYEDGKKALCCALVKGEKEGVYQEWYPDGKMKLEENYVGGQPDKVQRAWHPNGQLRVSCAYTRGEKQGIYSEFNEAGELVANVEYHRGMPVGEARIFYGKDQPKEIVSFKEGKREGKAEEYHPNGQLESVAFYVNDLVDGPVKVWLADGSLSALKQFKAGKQVGEQKEYFSKADLEKEGIMDKTSLLLRHFRYDDEGYMDGEQKTYHATGAVHTSISYKHGELDGLKSMWDREGTLLEEATYVQGKLCGRFFQRSQEGKEIFFQYKDNRREGLHEVYYPIHEYFGRVKALELNFANDLAEGDAIEYHESGAKIATTTYIKGKKEGVAQIFSPQGQLLMTMSFYR